MKSQIRLMVLSLGMVAAMGSAAAWAAEKEAQPAAQSGQASLGIRLDTNPLPELLVKHLRLEAGEGLLVSNVLKGSPADAAGIEQDDIIVAFQGNPVKGFGEFVGAVRAAGVGAEVAVEVIHRGERKTVNIKLTSWPKEQNWKYADRPVAGEPRQPGRVFRMNPGQRHWQEIPYGQTPEMRDFFRRFHSIPFEAPGDGFTPPNEPYNEENFGEQLRDLRRQLERLEQQFNESQKQPSPEKTSPDEEKSQSDEPSEYL
jgi:membrane-associated protease RseP (regulator of RpoE activity)